MHVMLLAYLSRSAGPGSCLRPTGAGRIESLQLHPRVRDTGGAHQDVTRCWFDFWGQNWTWGFGKVTPMQPDSLYRRFQNKVVPKLHLLCSPVLSWSLLGSLVLPCALLVSPGLSCAPLCSPVLSWAFLCSPVPSSALSSSPVLSGHSPGAKVCEGLAKSIRNVKILRRNPTLWLGFVDSHAQNP